MKGGTRPAHRLDYIDTWIGQDQLELLLFELAELFPVKGNGNEYRLVRPFSLVYEVLVVEDRIIASTLSAGVFGASAFSHIEGIVEDA